PRDVACGGASAMRAKGVGAPVMFTEVDPMPPIEAVMDGFQVMPMLEAAKVADILVTATGDKFVLDTQHLQVIKDGAIIANTGHFNVEIEIGALRAMATETRIAREFV